MRLIKWLLVPLAAAAEKVIHSRSDLPTLPVNCMLQVYYVEKVLSAGGTAAEIMQAFHSAIGLDASGCAGARQPRMLLEWYALDFPYGAVLPKVRGSNLTWNNTAVVGLKELNLSYWDKVHYIGGASGAQFNAWCGWVVTFSRANPAYQVWDVWSRASARTADHYFNDTVCDTFSQGALVELWRLGADFATQEPLQRDYIPLLAAAPPTVVNMSDQDSARTVAAYWAALSDLAHLHYANLSQFVDDLAALTSGSAYVYDATRRRYLHVSLAAPYLGLPLYQPMALPWQRPGRSRAGAAGTVETGGEMFE